MDSIYIDAETYCDHSVVVRDGGIGTYEYVRHKSTKPILWSINLTHLERSLVFEDPDFFAILDLLVETKHITWTLNKPIELVHWGSFDRELIRWQYQLPLYDDDELCLPFVDRPDGRRAYFRDLREQSLVYGAPGQLEHAAPFWTGTQTKDPGKKLIKMFCIAPRVHPKQAPVEWEQFRSYAGQDTAVLPGIDFAIQKAGGVNWSAHWPASKMVRRMNERGVPCDLHAADRCIKAIQDATEPLVERSVELCGLRPTQLQKLKDYLGLPNMQADTVEAFLARTDISDEHREIAEIQQAASGAAHKKLYAMQRMGATDGRVRGCFSYPGAHTRRLTSHDLQLQNFKRAAYDPSFFEHSPEEYGTGIVREVRENIRGFIATDKLFVAADYSAIECRVINWLAGEEWVLDLFRNGGDPYLTMASAFYGVEITDKEDPRRQLGKIGELQLGFGGGEKAVQTGAEMYGIEIPLEDRLRLRDVYRETHPNVVRLWEKCEIAMRHAMHGERVLVNAKILFEPFEYGVRVRRPSGFAQYLFNPQMEPTHTFWPTDMEKRLSGSNAPVQGAYDQWGILRTPTHHMNLTYVGRAKGGMMVRQGTYGGRIAQGVTQGTAGDLMYEGMCDVEEAGMDPVLSVHDEGVFEVDPSEWEGNVVEHVEQLMARDRKWTVGLPIKAEGWSDRRFTKA